MKRCSNCGSILDPGDRFCGECGHDNGAPIATPGSSTGQTERAGSSRWIIIGVLLVFGFCAVSIGSYVVVQMMRGIEIDDVARFLGLEDSVATPTMQPVGPRTQIYGVRMEHNVQFDGRGYLVLHIEHEVLQVDTNSVSVVAFIWLEGRSPMPSRDPLYEVAGQAATLEVAEVTFNPASYWEDFQLWIPYTAIEIGDNHYITVELQDAATGSILDAWVTEPFNVFP